MISFYFSVMWIYFQIEGRNGSPVRILGKYGTDCPVTIVTHDTLLQLHHCNYTELPEAIDMYTTDYKYIGVCAKACLSLNQGNFVNVYVTRARFHNNWICIGKGDEVKFQRYIFPNDFEMSGFE